MRKIVIVGLICFAGTAYAKGQKIDWDLDLSLAGPNEDIMVVNGECNRKFLDGLVELMRPEACKMAFVSMRCPGVGLASFRCDE